VTAQPYRGLWCDTCVRVLAPVLSSVAPRTRKPCSARLVRSRWAIRAPAPMREPAFLSGSSVSGGPRKRARSSLTRRDRPVTVAGRIISQWRLATLGGSGFFRFCSARLGSSQLSGSGRGAHGAAKKVRSQWPSWLASASGCADKAFRQSIVGARNRIGLQVGRGGRGGWLSWDVSSHTTFSTLRCSRCAGVHSSADREARPARAALTECAVAERWRPIWWLRFHDLEQ
jgi:hypothetical protein